MGIRVGLSILSMLVILIIGNQAAYAQTTGVWAFYGPSPVDQNTLLDCPPPTGVACKGQGTVDATNQGPSGANVAGCVDDVTCFPPVDTSDGGLIEVGHQIDWRSVAGIDPLIEVTCYTNAPLPNGDGSWDIDFGALTDFSCLQNQRAANDVGLGGTPITIAAPDDEINNNELIVLDLTLLVNGDYNAFMYRLSSNTQGDANDQAFLAFSDTSPSGMITLTNAETVLDLDTDVYKNFLTKKFLYIRAVSGDMLLQQIKAEVPVIGGTGIQIDTTSILLAGAQTNAYWILPIVVSATIIGIITIRRK